MSKIKYLIIGYGNTLRSDDGAGQWVAQRVQKCGLDNVKTILCHQLTPELADDIRQAEIVVFVDCIAIKPETSEVLEIRAIQAVETNSNLTHSHDPQSLLSLTQTVYQYCPIAYWLLISGVNFDFGEDFSEITQRGIDKALQHIKILIQQTNN